MLYVSYVGLLLALLPSDMPFLFQLP